MRRALIALIAALPALAAAQSTNPAEGTISTSDSITTMNIAQCSGTANTAIGLDDKLNVALTWTVKPNTAGTAVSGGLFRLYASKVQPAAGQNTGGSSTGTSCTLDTSNATIPSDSQGAVAPANNGNSTDIINVTSATTARSWTYSLKDIATAAHLSCTDSGTATVYLCVQWLNSSGAPSGFANASLTLDRNAPAAPTAVTSVPGDGMLHIKCTGDSTTGTYRAVATGGTGGPYRSDQVGACTDVRITGLTNGTQYSVVVYKMNGANNPSPASDALENDTTIPALTDDFWQHYGGRDSGGCATGAGAAGLLGALSILALTLVVRRRKS